jgi:hypothetical protein
MFTSDNSYACDKIDNINKNLPSDCICTILENIISINGKPICTIHKYLHMFRNDKIIVIF